MCRMVKRDFFCADCGKKYLTNIGLSVCDFHRKYGPPEYDSCLGATPLNPHLRPEQVRGICGSCRHDHMSNKKEDD